MLNMPWNNDASRARNKKLRQQLGITNCCSSSCSSKVRVVKPVPWRVGEVQIAAAAAFPSSGRIRTRVARFGEGRSPDNPGQQDSANDSLTAAVVRRYGGKLQAGSLVGSWSLNPAALF